MEFIDVNKPISYVNSSLRFFTPGEHHISRICRENVLLLVYEGVLRFQEDGKSYEIYPGQYHIQRQDSAQSGKYASDTPQYLYVHFLASWTNDENGLARSGTFDYEKFRPTMEELHSLHSAKAPHFQQAQTFYKLLSLLHPPKKIVTLADNIADFLGKSVSSDLSIDCLCQQFHFSKNHIINIFKREYGTTPISYLIELRLNMAESLMEATSDSLEQISLQCGFQTYSHFYKHFIRRHGHSPEQWRIKTRTGQHK